MRSAGRFLQPGVGSRGEWKLNIELKDAMIQGADIQRARYLAGVLSNKGYFRSVSPAVRQNYTNGAPVRD